MACPSSVIDSERVLVNLAPQPAGVGRLRRNAIRALRRGGASIRRLWRLAVRQCTSSTAGVPANPSRPDLSQGEVTESAVRHGFRSARTRCGGSRRSRVSMLPVPSMRRSRWPVTGCRFFHCCAQPRLGRGLPQMLPGGRVGDRGFYVAGPTAGRESERINEALPERA